MGELYTVAAGGSLSAGRWRGASGPSGEWNAVSVSAYSFVPTRDSAGNPRYDFGVDVAQTDAGGAITSNKLPFREFSKPSPTDDGVLYYHGGLHSGYAGNDILKITLGAALTVQQLARPHVPIAGDIGYSTSGSNNLWKNYTPALAVGDRDQWQPYTYHNYCKNTWHPRLGYLLTCYYPASWDGNGFPVSSHTTYGDYDGRTYGTVRYHEATNRYTLQSASPQDWILQDLSDYCPMFDGILGLSHHNGAFNWLEMSARTGDVWVYQRTVTPTAETGAGNQFNAGNGTVIKHLDGWRFLLLHQNPTRQYLWIYDHYTGAATGVTLPLAADEQQFVVAIDKAGKRIFCGHEGATLRVFQSYFDTPSTWVELTTTGAPSIPSSAGREPLFYWRGSLYAFDFQAELFYRVVVDGDHPSISFAQIPTTFTSAKGYPVAVQKHVNLAYCPLDGCVYYHGGDVTESYSQEMFKYHVATNTWTQIQNECGADPSGNVNGIRPLNPDDGGWMWDATEAKFWWFPGGGMLAQASGTSYPRKCADMPTNAQWEAIATTYGGIVQPGGKRDTATYFNAIGRWKVHVPMQFDPVAGTWAVVDFTATNTDGWPDDVLQHFYGGENGRGNAYDPVARKFFRIIIGGGFHICVADLATRTWRPFTTARLADETPFNDTDLQTQSYGIYGFAVDPANGRLYGMRNLTGELFYIDTRGAPILHNGGPGYRLPVYVLANPVVPAPGSYGADHNYLRIFKGGILFWYNNNNDSTSPIRGAWWRSLTNIESSEWVPVQFPFDMTANSITTNKIGTDQYFVMGPPQAPLGQKSSWIIS